MKTKSLTRRTVGIVVTAQILCALLLCTVALINERHTRLRALDAQLRAQSASLLGAMRDSKNSDRKLTVDPLEFKPPATDVYAVYDPGGHLLTSSATAPASLIARETNGFREARNDGSYYRVLQRDVVRTSDDPSTNFRRPVTTVYAVSEHHVWHEVFEAAGFDFGTITVAAIATVFLVAFALRKALRPLAELANAADRISAPALRFDSPASALQLRELQPLTNKLSESAARLRESFAREHRFVGDAAHELKTAIAVVRSSVQLLMLKPRSDKEYQQGLNRVLEDTTRLELIVVQMLRLARFEEDSKPQLQVVDLNDAIQNVVSILDPVAESHGLRIDVKTSTDLNVRLPREAAEILFSNILLNAIQHSKGPAEVLVSARKLADSRVCLEVADTGSGIRPEALPHIFERFYREDASRSRDTGGTGLGLAICKSIVESAGGIIQAKSIPHQGTTVSIILTSHECS